MEKLILYCKSYINDVHRAKILLDSVIKYNTDKIPFYISVPKSDIQIFQNVLGISDYILIADEEIDTDNTGWRGQQIVKSQFWKLNLCDNYINIDSDCFFIRPFYITDFMYSENIPYTICHEYKSFFEFMDRHPVEYDPYIGFEDERRKIMNLFGRSGVVYDFGPCPPIWSVKVWKSLFNKYIYPNNLTFSDLIKTVPSEFTWYGEWLMRDKTIPLIPRGPLFKNYHYKIQYDYDKLNNYSIELMAKRYMGIGMQSNFPNEAKY